MGFLLDEWHRALRAEVTSNCHMVCSSCGAAKFRCGVCYNESSGTQTLRAGTSLEYVYPVLQCNPVPGMKAEEP